MATINNLPPAVQKRYRKACSKGGKNGSHADKVRAGKAGFAARLKKLQEAAEKEKAANQAQ